MVNIPNLINKLVDLKFFKLSSARSVTVFVSYVQVKSLSAQNLVQLHHQKELDDLDSKLII